MKKQIFLFVFALILIYPAFSFKNFNEKAALKNSAAKWNIVELGQFNYDGYMYTVYINDVTNAITGVMYTNGFDWYDVYSFRGGTYNPSVPNYVTDLKIWRTSTSGSFTYTGAVLPQ